MKKLIISLFMILSMIIAVIAAPPVPAPVKIVVSVNGVDIHYEDTKVTNKFTGEVLTKEQVSSLEIINGVGVFDLSQFEQGYEAAGRTYSGDEIEIVACNVDPACTTTFLISDTNPRTISISVNTDNLHVCWDNSLVSNPNDCPAQPEPEQEYVCWDESVVNDPSLCPDVPVVEEDPVEESRVSGDGRVASVEAYYGQKINVVLTDTKLSKLFDGEIDFDGEKYDAEEVILFQATPETSIFDEDFGTDPYVTIPEGAVEYRFVIKDSIDLSDIDEDEPLEISFLGKTLKIIDASESQITVRFGTVLGMTQGETAQVNGKDIEVLAVMVDSVQVSVDSVSGTILLDDSNEINGLDVLVDSISYQGWENGVKLVTLIVGDKVQDTYQDGDYFDLFKADDEEYKWVISLGDTQVLGVRNSEAYIGIDEDDDYQAIGVGEVLVLPNNFLEVKFKSITTPTETELGFRVKDDYLYITGPEDAFSYGTEEYDRLYVNDDGFHDEDKDFITDEEVRIGSSETYLELGSVIIMDLEIELDMSDILYNGISWASEEGNFMDYLGIKWFDAEKGVDDQIGFKVSIPEEDPEALITFRLRTVSDDEDDDVTTTTVPDDVEEPVVTTTTTVAPVVTITVPPVTTTTTLPSDDDDEDEGSNLKTILITLIAAIIGFFGWGKGFAGLIKYYLRKADEAAKAGDKELAAKYRARAEKMARTVVTNYLAGKYKK